MNTILNTNCPVSGTKINGTAARAAAFYTILITTVSWLTGNYILMALLATDFGMRAFGFMRYSPLRNLSVITVNLLHLKQAPTDAAPKKFAAGLGMIFSLAIATSLFFGNPFWSAFVAGILIFCAFLEGAFAFCLGCIVYSFLIRIFPFSSRIQQRE